MKIRGKHCYIISTLINGTLLNMNPWKLFHFYFRFLLFLLIKKKKDWCYWFDLIWFNNMFKILYIKLNLKVNGTIKSTHSWDSSSIFFFITLHLHKRIITKFIFNLYNVFIWRGRIFRMLKILKLKTNHHNQHHCH